MECASTYHPLPYSIKPCPTHTMFSFKRHIILFTCKLRNSYVTLSINNTLIMKVSQYMTWGFMLVLFTVSYFLLDKNISDKIETCCFYTVLILFNIWRAVTVKNKV